MARGMFFKTTMEPGQRDRVITLQQLTDGVHDSGAPKEEWTTLVASMPAAKREAVGRERFQANQDVASSDVVFEINYRADMDPDLIDVPKKRRIVYGTRIYDIVGAEEIGRRVGVRLMTLANQSVVTP